ncbi:MAG: hypothetical protein RL143_804 [Pseudomonadota bacterium]
MRQLMINATPWQLIASGDDWAVSECASNRFNYLSLMVQDRHYLYAEGLIELGLDERGVWVLGVFDTSEQLQMFLALHNDNPLKVPALRIESDWPVVSYTDANLESYAHYQGVYRVGFKSYRVTQTESETLLVNYIDGYKSELLGEFNEEVEACLKVYSHFDARTRGCKMC